MAQHKSKFYTLLVLDDDGRVWRRRVSRQTATALALGLGGAALVVLALLLVVVGDRFTIARLARQARGPVSVNAPITTTDTAAPAALDRDVLEAAAKQTDVLAGAARYFAAVVTPFVSRPYRWPLRGWVTSEFGPRKSPVTGAPEMHQGLDIAASVGSEVKATAAGQVLWVDEQPGFGLVVAVAHGFGVTSFFGHLDQALVAEGQKVAGGQTIARSGNSGISTGPHLHYELRRFGLPVDPRAYLPGLGQAQASP
jgi:murein DD-endopeptidase MepM/ murein hydrolase activator NlpD